MLRKKSQKIFKEMSCHSSLFNMKKTSIKEFDFEGRMNTIVLFVLNK